MLNKKIIILTIILISLLTISVVSAAENVTDDFVSLEETTDDSTNDIICVDDTTENNYLNNNVSKDQDILGNSESQDEISLDNNSNILSIKSPSSSDYSVSISAPTTYYEDSSGTITVNIVSPCTTSGYYSYHFILTVLNSNGGTGYSMTYSGTSSSPVKYTFNPKQYGVGTHKITVQNYAEPTIMAKSTLTIREGSNPNNPSNPTNPPSNTYPAYTDYSVSVSDTVIDYGSSGTISMSITPASSSTYKYYYYLEISGNNEAIVELYKGTTATNSKTYTIDTNKLSPGGYEVKIVNYVDKHVMDSAILTIKSDPIPFWPSYTDYSVNVSDTTINYGSSAKIGMSIIPSSSSTVKYYYTLKIYDSNNNEKFSKMYLYTDGDDYYQTYTISANQLSVGTYYIKIINEYDYKVMSTATLTVKSGSSSSTTYPTYSDYSVSVSSSSMNYGSTGSISMSISPASSSTYKYYYTMKVYDSNNNEKISQSYYGTSAAYSKTYTVSANQLSVGTYTVKIINYADSKVMSTATLTVKSGSSSSTTYPTYSDYSVSVSDTAIKYGTAGSISMSISPASSSTYKYYYNLEVYDSNNNLCAGTPYYSTSSDYSKTYAISSNSFAPGIYTIKIVNWGDNKVMDTAKLTVYKGDVKLIVPSTVYTEYTPWSNLDNILVKIDNDIYDGMITLNINSKNINKPVEFNWKGNHIWYSAEFSLSDLKLTPGTYSATISYNGNQYYNSAHVNIKVIVKKASTSTFAESKTAQYGDTIDLIFDTYEPGYKVSVKINGVSKSFTTSKDGYIRVPVNGLVPKTYTVTVTFNGNNLYEKSVSNIKVTVKKGTTKITAKAKTFKKSVKTKKYTITLKHDLNNKPINKVKVTLKVNGKTYKSTTNSKGKATFKINKLTKKGKHTCTIKFVGNKYYNKITKKVNIKVK